MAEFGIPQEVFDRWLGIRAANDKPPIPQQQLKGHIDHSALLRRLRQGQEPYDEPPPLSDGQPWYRLLDEGFATRCRVSVLDLDHPMSKGQPTLLINDSSFWRIEKRISPAEYVARYSETSALFRVFVTSPSDPYPARWSIERLSEE